MKLATLSGERGVGKTTIAGHLVHNHGFKRVRSATTRPPRPGEGCDEYDYVTPGQFEMLLDQDQFVEHIELNGYRYGAYKLDESVAKHVAVLTVDGVKQFEAMYGSDQVFRVCVIPIDTETYLERISPRPDAEELRRLAARCNHDGWIPREMQVVDFLATNFSSVQCAGDIARHMS